MSLGRSLEVSKSLFRSPPLSKICKRFRIDDWYMDWIGGHLFQEAYIHRHGHLTENRVGRYQLGTATYEQRCAKVRLRRTI